MSIATTEPTTSVADATSAAEGDQRPAGVEWGSPPPPPAAADPYGPMRASVAPPPAPPAEATPAEAPPAPTLADVESREQRLAAQRAEWEGKLGALRRQLAEAEQGAASAALAGTSTTQLASKIARLREEIAIAGGALDLLAQQLPSLQADRRAAMVRDAWERCAEAEAAVVALWERVVAAWPPIEALLGIGPELVRHSPRSRLAVLDERAVMARRNAEHRQGLADDATRRASIGGGR